MNSGEDIPKATELSRDNRNCNEEHYTTLHPPIRIPIEKSGHRRKARQEEQRNMMPQREAGSPIDEQAGSTYGNYEGNQADAYQQFETSYQQPLQGEQAAKVYARAHGNKNMLRLTAFVITMLMLIVLAVFCLVITGGTGGWISFCVASLIVFILAVVVIDKLE